MNRARLLAAAAALAFAGCGGNGTPAPAPTPAVEGAGSATGRPASARTAEAPKRAADRPASRRERDVARPVRLEIPAIGVAAPVIALGLNRDRSLEVPEGYGDTGWWTGGPEPGERGPAVIAGHVDSKSGPAVFYRLRELEPGDEVIVRRRDGSAARFRVTRSERVSKDRFPTARVYGDTAGSELRLVTCSGDFDSSSGHYVDNTIVYARSV